MVIETNITRMLGIKAPIIAALALIAYLCWQFKTSEVCLAFYIDAVCHKTEMSPYWFVCDVCSAQLFVL